MRFFKSGSRKSTQMCRLETLKPCKIASRKRLRTHFFALFCYHFSRIGALAGGRWTVWGAFAVVVQQTKDIGIRMALGGAKSDVVKLIVNQGMSLTLIGIIAGIAASYGLTRFLSVLLYGVKPADPLALSAVSAVLIFAAFVATYFPARRATSVDPLVALRHE